MTAPDFEEEARKLEERLPGFASAVLCWAVEASPFVRWPIGLLFISNIFMTFAWYGQLGAVSRPIWLAVLIAWGIAFFEYCLVIPANRIGYGVYSAAELKTLQEVITLIIFAGFAVFWLGEKLTVNHLVGFGLIAAGAFFIFKGPIAV